MSEKAHLTIKLPMRVVKEISKLVPDTNYTCITDYIEKQICNLFPEPEVTAEEKELFKERLRKLGYIE